MTPTVIYKFQLELTDTQSIAIPRDAQILSCQMQHGRLCLWALVDPSQPIEARYFDIFGTGSPYECESGKHAFISTVQDSGLVWHVLARVNSDY